MPTLVSLMTTLAAQTSDGALPEDATRRGWAMFALVALLGITLVATAGMLAMLNARRRRARNKRPIRPADPRDPWQVSAERMVEVKEPDP